MWSSKIGLKVAALVLVGAVSSMAVNSSISPLTFGASSAQQEVNNWNYLTKFKLWGTTGIQFGNRPEFFDTRYYNKSGSGNYTGVNILDSLGWVGTATGSLTSSGVSGWLDGPIIVGGSVSTQNEMTLVTGPVRTGTGNISCRHNGTTCRGQDASGACSYDKVPEIRSDLKIPTLSGVNFNSYGALNLTKTDSERRTVFDISNSGQSTCGSTGVCDLYFSSINFGDDNRLVIKMPKGGRITRIFTGSISLKNHPQIVVSYDETATNKNTDLKPSQYEGNLMIYVNSGGMSLSNTDNADFEGTFVVNGNITIKSNMTIAGQLIANNIIIGDEFSAKNFVFVPFVVWPELSILGNNAIYFDESDTWVPINVALSSESTEPVIFDYCFDFHSPDGIRGQYAGYKDVGEADSDHNFPICDKGQSKRDTIKVRETKAKGINIKPLIDGIIETNEALWFQINNLTGAQLASSYEKSTDGSGSGYKIYIVSHDEAPSVSSQLVIDVNEDAKHVFTADEFKFQHKTQKFASVIIASIPARGTLAFNGTEITASGKQIAVADLSKLTYQPEENEFGNNYTTFRYQVVGDGSGDNKSQEYLATVNVIPVNDKPNVADVTFSVNELDHAITGGPIKVVDVSNEINVDTYSYILDSSSEDYEAFNSTFKIVSSGNGKTATIEVKEGAVLDYSVKKQYVVYATVKDDAKTETKTVNGPLSYRFKITVLVKNENDPPVIENQSFSLYEKDPDGNDWTSAKIVGNVVALDPDGDGLSFTILDSDIPFAFKNSSNELHVKDGSKLDFETHPTWIFKVSVSDGDLSSTATITVNLMDVNEPPFPPEVNRNYSVKENSADGFVLGTFTVKDADKISGSFETLTYKISGELLGAVNKKGSLTGKTLADLFTLKETSVNTEGERTVSILVKDGSLLDYEELYKENAGNATYQATISITDTKGHVVSKNTNIVIEDVNEPFDVKDGTFELLEHSPGGSPVCTKYDNNGNCPQQGQIEASDLDLYNSSFSTLTFKKSSNTGDATKFEIGEHDGKVRTANSAEFKYDATKPTYSFMVTVSDGGSSKEIKVTVKIIDVEEPPKKVYVDGSALIPENSSQGTEVDRFKKEYLSAEDQAKFADLGDEDDITYEIMSTSESENSPFPVDSLFSIVATEGIIKVNKKKFLDYEALNPGYDECDVVIIAHGKGGNTVEITRHIAITDVNETPISRDTTFSVGEDLKSKGVVGTLWATDPDSCSNTNINAMCRNGQHESLFNKLTYSIVDDTGIPFEIDADIGEITLKDGEKLRFKNKKQYVFDVKVSDRSKDKDNPPQSTVVQVTINVTDVNEPSEFRTLADLYETDENVTTGSILKGDKIVVYDEDDADIDKLTISITDNDPRSIAAEDLFEIKQDGKTENSLSTFVIKTKAGVDYETLYRQSEESALFDVTLSIKDGSGRITKKTTTIRVNDVNEEPSFMKDKYEFTIDENVTVATLLGMADASDPDFYTPEFHKLYFSLEGDDAAMFDIDASNGEISSINNAKFDYETKNSYSFYAVVTDKKFTKKVPVMVSVIDKPEVPRFPDDPPALVVDENTKEGTVVGMIVAEDDDCKGSLRATCKMPKYSLAATDIDADDYKAFTIDADGTIKVAKDSILDYEVQDEYSVRIVATDGADPTLSSYIDVVIKVNDVNDAPKYQKKEYVFEIHENAPKGEFIGNVVASDQDEWSKLTYSISDYVSASKDAEAFKIYNDGKIYLNAALNFEKKSKYQIVATATDNGSDRGFENYTATTIVTINLIDDPDPPTIDDDNEDYDVFENTIDNNTPTGFEIACYDVHDEDVGQTEKLVAYVKDAGETDADRLFDAKIKKKDASGYQLCLVVKNGDRLSYESVKHVHNVIVAVMDADNLTASINKKITLKDVNEMPIISGSASFSFYDENKVGYVIGKLYSDDIDTSKVFTDNVFSVVGGDTDDFEITEDGKIKAKRVFDFQNDTTHLYELIVALSDRDKDKYPKLKTLDTITISLKNKPKVPEITSTEFSVEENSEKDVLVGKLEATDPDGSGNLLFELMEENPYVVVKPDGEIRVREGADIDYEKMQEFTILVSVKDEDGLISDKEILIKVIDVNEPPKITPQEFTFSEDSKPGTTKGPIEAKDPDTKNPKFNDLKFYSVGDNDKFEVKTNGEIVLKSELDYEDKKSYVIKVRVTDGEFSDTTDITVNVGNVVEKAEVEITRVEARDSIYRNPDTLYVNVDQILVEWKQNGKIKSSLDSLKEGKNIIIKTFKDPTMDIEGADTVVVFFSKAPPVVEVSATKTKVEAENFYTVVETVDKKDSSIYVNMETKDVKVTVKDTVSGYEETFTVDVKLETITVPKTAVETLVDVSKSKPKLDKNPKSDVSESLVNGDRTKVSYTETVKGKEVTVSYNVDDKGNIIKVPVVDEKGKKVMTEVIEVSTTVEVKGKQVTVSYKADAATGKMLYGDSEGNLMVEIPSSSSSKKDSEKSSEVDLKTGVGAFTVTYDSKGVEGNKATVTYVVDEKGNIVANEEGDKGYLVTYTYTNKFGNTGEKSVFMVLDKTKPLVIINSPSKNEVFYTNFVDVDWCIAVDGDAKNCVKQDTLNFQSLDKGLNRIKRIYRDKAGNEYIAEVEVMMKKAKDVDITLEKPMVIVTIDSVDKYYSVNPPDEDQSFSVSVLNPTTQKETEIVKGNVDKTKKGSGDEPYPGLDGHLGPTIRIDMKVPVVNNVGGLATLDDIIVNDMIPLNGVDAATSEKLTVKEYVKEYCSEEFQKELAKNKDYSKAKLYSTNANVSLWFYAITGGQYIDEYNFSYDIDDPAYVDKAGLVKLYFEHKLDKDGELRDSHGRLYGTGPFLVRVNVDMRSKLRCVIPSENLNAKVGDVLKSGDEMLRRFGYRRPVLHGKDRALKATTKKDSKKSKK